jgi:hypothetical protein
MSPEKDDKLCKDFPLLYADRHRSMTETCMCWGFTCNDGWYDIIYRLSAKLESLIEACDPVEGEKPRAVQVKEKFGSLRFYMSFNTDEMSDLIREAEKESDITCEDCGKPGRLWGKSWLRTNCQECESKIKKELYGTDT